MSFGVDRGTDGGRCDPVGDLRLAVDGLLDLDPLEAPGALKDDLLRFARHRSREDAVFASWVLVAVRNQVGVEDGYVDAIGWLSWKTGISRSELRKIMRLAELCELLPDTGAAWRSGAVSTAAVEMIAGARVPNFDDELRAMEAEFLERAKRGDHKTLGMLTAHFRKCARADGSKPEPPDGCTIAAVGDRMVLRADCTTTSGQTVREALETFTRAPVANDEVDPRAAAGRSPPPDL